MPFSSSLRALACAFVLVAPTFGALAQNPSPIQAADADADAWRARLRTDAQAMHDLIRDNHPGPVDAENPGFNRVLDDGLARALKRADTTTNFGGYWWALREYQASFDDGHLQLATKPEWSPALPTRWPGFLTRYDNGQHVVAVRDASDRDAPAEGARLVSCDGIDAQQLADTLVGHFRGRWFLESQRVEHAGRLFVDADNPWVTRPRTCRFIEGDRERDITLRWRDLPADEFGPIFARTQSAVQAPVELRGMYGNTGVWLSMGSFDGTPGREGYAQLDALMQRLRSEPRVETADVIVLDVRGNGGGSSHWSRIVAEQLWGTARIEAQDIGSDAVDWRASAANLESMEEYRTQLEAQASPDPDVVAWMNDVITGLRRAVADHAPLWHQVNSDDEPDPAPARGRLKPGARVYVLADSSCASACLDALDLWKALGAVQLGRTTSADTVYMEVRGHRLPSGFAGIGIPMKVYRGRPRGHNQPYAPDIPYPGRLDDDIALEAWVLGLAGAPALTATR